MYENGFCTTCDAYESAVFNFNLPGYEISNAGQLYWFAELVNEGASHYNGKLLADIVVNENVLNADGTLNGDGSNFRVWTPIGEDYYLGNFDGNGKTVSGLYFNNTSYNHPVGLFDSLGSECIVQNLGVVDSYLLGMHDVGGVVGLSYGGYVLNCYNTGSVSGWKDVGGVVGTNQNGGFVNYCYNTGSINGSGSGSSSNIGGVVGYNYYGSVRYSYNAGSVTGNEGGNHVGGVVGENYYGTVYDCYNTGNVDGFGLLCLYVGGVVGRNTSGTIGGCYNTGNISGSDRASWIGGVVGVNGSEGAVNNCYNTGSVSSSSSSMQSHLIGGVAGSNDGYINYCYNTGNINVIGIGEDVGGVVGYSGGTMWQCYNTGSVNGGDSSDRVGGVAGRCAYPEGEVDCCYNVGSVTGREYVGGVAGKLSEGTISRCHNYGSISGSGEFIGGVVADNYLGTLYKCYYLMDAELTDNGFGQGMTAEQFASGEICYQLQDRQALAIWGQLIGVDEYPTLDDSIKVEENGDYYYKNIGVVEENGYYYNKYFHNWVDATCFAPKTCADCGMTAGDATEHEAFTYSYDSTKAIHNLTCALCGEVVTKTATDGKKYAFNTAAPTLSDDIVMNIATTLPAGFSDPYMVVEFNGVITTITDYTINESNGRYVFAFAGLNSQTMGDTFHAALCAYVDDVRVTVELDYSMMKYINSQLKKEISAELRTALSDLVMYGEYNQIYEGYKTDALLSTLLEDTATLTPSTFTALDDTYNKQVTAGTKDANIDLKGISLTLGSKIVVRLTVYCADPSAYSVKVNIGDKVYTYAVSDLKLADGYTDRYVVEFDQIKATQFGEVITFSFLDAGGNQVGRTLEYSVYTYVQKNQNSTDANLVNLLQAIYNYGEAVKKI